MPVVEIDAQALSFSRKVQGFCLKHGKSFPRGCPNFGKKKGCPPQPLIDRVLDLSEPVFIIYTDHDIQSFAQRMRNKHPNWTVKQCHNPRYWQRTARKLHVLDIQKFLARHSGTKVITCPEAHGVNLHETMEQQLGIVLEWPPRILTRLISLAGTRKGRS